MVGRSMLSRRCDEAIGELRPGLETGTLAACCGARTTWQACPAADLVRNNAYQPGQPAGGADGGVGVLGVTGEDGQGGAVQEIVKAKGFEVVDDQGKTRAVVAMTKDGSLP